MNKNRNIFIDNITPEALSQELDGIFPYKALSSNDGGSIFQGPALRDIPLLNKAWDGSPITINRVSREAIKINEYRLTIAVATQPSSFSKFMKENGDKARGSGFLARALLTYPQSTQGTRTLDYSDLEHKEYPRLIEFQNKLYNTLKQVGANHE